MAAFVGFQPLCEHKLQFVPRWVVDKGIKKDRSNYVYMEAFIPV